MNKILDNIKKNFKVKVTRGPEGEKVETDIRSVEDAANYLRAVKDAADRMERGECEAPDVEVTTATSIERREFLNYCINLMDDKYIKHKILLFLRVNPFKENPATGEETYLSKKEIARVLTERVGRKVFETEVDAIEGEALKIAKDSLASCKQKNIPLVGKNSF
jgi:hypothetical protein